jgi:hypothetical protein
MRISSITPFAVGGPLTDLCLVKVVTGDGIT